MIRGPLCRCDSDWKLRWCNDEGGVVVTEWKKVDVRRLARVSSCSKGIQCNDEGEVRTARMLWYREQGKRLIVQGRQRDQGMCRFSSMYETMLFSTPIVKPKTTRQAPRRVSGSLNLFDDLDGLKKRGR